MSNEQEATPKPDTAVQIEWPKEGMARELIDYYLSYLRDEYHGYVKKLGRSYLIASAGLGISVRAVVAYAWFQGDNSFAPVEFDEQIRFLNGLSQYFFGQVNNTLEHLEHLSQEHAFWYWLLVCVVFVGIPLNIVWISLLATKREYFVKNLYEKIKQKTLSLVGRELSEVLEKLRVLRQKVGNELWTGEIELN